MKKEDFSFDLPPELIAHYPLPSRSDSRLLVYSRQNQQVTHAIFKDIIQFLEPSDLLVMNNSRVIPARIYGQKLTGGKVELLVERLINTTDFLAHIKASKSPKQGTKIDLGEGWILEMITKEEDLYYCRVNGKVIDMLQAIGHIPLPPYIARNDEQLDKTRYQTVYAEHDGSVAAPTAGLHFDEMTMAALKAKGVKIAYTTLHVGAGTFRPVRTESIYDHKMHSEYMIVDEAVCEAVKQTKASGGRVIAVGTTALRSLESAAIDGELVPACRETDIFIYPGFDFKVCDGLLTNFHLSESTLLMLVSAFIGHREAMDLYQIAIENQYRFFSYGDASLLL